MLDFSILFLLFICLILILIVAWSLKNGIGPMPTSLKARRILLDNLPSDYQGIIYELGSGWGTLAFPIAQKYSHCTVIAYENSPIPYLFSKIRYLFYRHKNLHIKRQDFFYIGLGKANMVVCYLYPEAMRQLKEKFEKELMRGTLVVSNTFAIPGWKAHKIFEVKDIYHTKIYIYIYE